MCIPNPNRNVKLTIQILFLTHTHTHTHTRSAAILPCILSVPFLLLFIGHVVTSSVFTHYLVYVFVAVYTLSVDIVCMVAQLSGDPMEIETKYISRLLGLRRISRFPKSEEEWGFIIFIASNLLLCISSIVRAIHQRPKASSSTNTALRDPLMTDDDSSKRGASKSFFMRFANLPCITFLLIAWSTINPSLLTLPLLLVALSFVATPPEMLRNFHGLTLNLTMVYAGALCLLEFTSSLPPENPITSNGIFDLDFRLGSLLHLSKSTAEHFAALIDLFFFGVFVLMCRCVSEAQEDEDEEQDLEFGEVEESYIAKFFRLLKLITQQCTWCSSVVPIEIYARNARSNTHSNITKTQLALEHRYFLRRTCSRFCNKSFFR